MEASAAFTTPDAKKAEETVAKFFHAALFFGLFRIWLYARKSMLYDLVASLIKLVYNWIPVLLSRIASLRWKTLSTTWVWSTISESRFPTWS